MGRPRKPKPITPGKTPFGWCISGPEQHKLCIVETMGITCSCSCHEEKK